MKKTTDQITEEKINRKIKKQITAVIVVGILIILADIVSSSSGAITFIEEHGRYYMIRPEEDEAAGHLNLKATVQTDSGSIDKTVNIRLDPYSKTNKKEGADTYKEAESAESDEERIGYELRSMAGELNADSRMKKIELPAALDSGEKISWEIQRQTNTLVILTGITMLCAIIFFNRNAPLKKQRKEQEESVLSGLPEFVNRLVLLLNAGLVINSAFEKTIEESFGLQNNSGDYFTEKMREIYISVNRTNGVMHSELRSFARECGVKELIRISNIINDNVSKGVELTDKLRNENDLLWMNRKKNCEERCRLAETKLTLPLVIFLVVLIVIVTAPAMLEL